MLVVSRETFLEWLPVWEEISSPKLTGRMRTDAVRATYISARGFGGWRWNEVRSLSAGWFDGLAAILVQFEESGVLPVRLFDSFIVTIPRESGDATPAGQRPSSISLTAYRLRATVSLTHIQNWFASWLPD